MTGTDAGTNEYFSSLAAGWVDRYRTRGSFVQRLVSVSGAIQSTISGKDAPRVLDIGAGAAVFSVVASTWASKVFAVDVSPNMTSEAQKNLAATAELVRGYGFDPRVEAIEFTTGTLADLAADVHGNCDLVLMVAVLEYIAEPTATLAGARPLLAPGGVIVATVPDDRSVLRRAERVAKVPLGQLRRLSSNRRLADRQYASYTFRRTEADWDAIVAAAGLRVRRRERVPLGPRWPHRLVSPNRMLHLSA